MRIIGYAKARVGQPFHSSARKGLEGSRRRRGGPWRLVVGALSYAGQLNITGRRPGRLPDVRVFAHGVQNTTDGAVDRT
jgi:hypothetical protein